MNIPAAYTIATTEQSRSIDADTTQKFGIDGFTLMEVAGSSAAKRILKNIEPRSHGVFLCGKGNNSGDALVVARYLSQHDIRCTIVFVGGHDDLAPAALKNLKLLQTIAENDTEAPLTFIETWAAFDTSLQSGFIVDGMLGTGLDSNLRGNYKQAVQWTNAQTCEVFAMDIPTGLHADSGHIMGDAIKADHTCTFGVLKQGFYVGEGHKQTGAIHFCELPFPNYLMRTCSTYLIDDAWVPDHKQQPAKHKYEAGIVYIIAGSEGLSGAAIMAAKSAWAEGVGAVIMICPHGMLPIFENNLPQIIKKPIGAGEDVHFKEEHLEEVLAIIKEKKGTVLMGPGLGRKKTTSVFAQQLLAQVKGDIILDADGLWALAQQKKWKKPKSSSWILTPHPGELSTLLSKKISDDAHRLEEVINMAQQKDITLLSKGFPVMVGTPKGEIYLSRYDTRVFSRAGFGDVLAGKVAAYNALGFNTEESCIKALLNGHHKVTSLLKNYPHHIPEPLDLI